ncbi:MAG: DUF3747 domain-containing protein, partial [Leptolyngbyaceae bacterium]|nr:DUF3747 domain-containing protein [Leptolyngbyaceae bacterium]
MNSSLQIGAIALAMTGLTALSGFNSVRAATSFQQQEVDQAQFIAVAAPRGSRNYQLLILQQVSNKRPCWNVQPGTPAVVEPLLLNFDFKGICSRSTDSNGYSIRVAGEDLALTHSLRVVERNGDLLLVGVSNKDRKAPEIEIGKTYGVQPGFSQIVLNPGWRFAQRSLNGKVLGHVYLTNDSPLPSNLASPPPTAPTTVTTPSSTPAPATPPAIPPVVPVAPPVKPPTNPVPSSPVAPTASPAKTPTTTAPTPITIPGPRPQKPAAPVVTPAQPSPPAAPVSAPPKTPSNAVPIPTPVPSPSSTGTT